MFVSNPSNVNRSNPSQRNADNGWYIVEALSGKTLIAKMNMQQQGFRTFHPEFHTRVNQFGKVAMRLRPLFPGYLFVNCSLADGRWRAIKSTRGVKRFAGPPGAMPVPVKQALMEELMARCPQGVLDPSIGELEIGEHVRLEDCAFAGAFAQVHELDDAGRVRVLVSLLGADRLVSVPRSSIRTM